MPLDLPEAASMLGVSPDTVRRWARQGRLGMMLRGGEFRFEVVELQTWARNQGLRLQEAGSATGRVIAGDAGAQPLTIALARGTVLHEVVGASAGEVLSNLVELAPLAESVDRLELVRQLQGREALASTGLGGGVALPHPRTPSTDFVEQALVVIAMLETPIDWHALDGAPVHTAILLVSPSPQEHLKVLSRLAFVLRDSKFQQLLAARAEADAVRERVNELEPREE